MSITAAKIGAKMAKKIAGAIGNTVLNNDGRKGSGGITALVAGFVSLVFIAGIAISLPGILLKSAFRSINGGSSSAYSSYTFEQETLEEYDLYKDVMKAYSIYFEGIESKIDSKIQQLKKDYTYEVKETLLIEVIPSDYYNNMIIMQDGKTYIEIDIKKKVEPAVITSITGEKPEARHLMAYISVKHLNGDSSLFDYADHQIVDDSSFNLNKYEAEKFFDKIFDYQEQIKGVDPIYYDVKYKSLDTEEIARFFFSGDEIEIYKNSYGSMEGMME